MHNPESVLENETHKLLWDFEIPVDHQISVRRSDLKDSQQKKKKREPVELWTLLSRLKLKESENKDKYLDRARELKKKNCGKWRWYQFVWCTRCSHQRIGTGTEGIGNKRTSGDHPNNSIIEIGQNTEKSPGDLRRLGINQTLVRNHRLMLVWKTLKGVNNKTTSYTLKRGKVKTSVAL